MYRNVRHCIKNDSTKTVRLIFGEDFSVNQVSVWNEFTGRKAPSIPCEQWFLLVQRPAWRNHCSQGTPSTADHSKLTTPSMDESPKCFFFNQPSEVSLRKATRIRAFPRTAVIDRKTFAIERKISSPCTSAVNSAEQDSTTIAFWFSPSVKFFSANTGLPRNYAQVNAILIYRCGALLNCFTFYYQKLILAKCAVFT